MELQMGREDARNMQSFITEYNWIIGASGWLFKKKKEIITFLAITLSLEYFIKNN
jgi:hypothetical protein